MHATSNAGYAALNLAALKYKRKAIGADSAACSGYFACSLQGPIPKFALETAESAPMLAYNLR